MNNSIRVGSHVIKQLQHFVFCFRAGVVWVLAMLLRALRMVGTTALPNCQQHEG